MNVHFSSKSNEWTTPQHLFDELNQEFNFTLDPCATEENAKCSKHFTIEDDGLSKDWSNDVVFMNPPYGREIKNGSRKHMKKV
nr:phage N-6-adenine-methyltransferase [Staphylococcus haemolyticus]